MPQLRLPRSTALFFPITSHVTMGELLNPLEPQFIYQQKGYSTLPSVPLSKVYLQHLQYNVGLSAFGHTYTYTHTHTQLPSSLFWIIASHHHKQRSSLRPLSWVWSLLMCTSLTLLLLDHPRPAFSPSQRPPMKSPKSTNSFSSPPTSPTTGQSFQKPGQQQCPSAVLSTWTLPSFRLPLQQDKSSKVLLLVCLSQKSWLLGHWIKSTPWDFPQSHVSASALLRPWSTPAKLLEFEPHEVHHATHKMVPWNLFKPPWSFKAQLLHWVLPSRSPRMASSSLQP